MNIVLKLSGGGLGGQNKAYDEPTIRLIADQVQKLLAEHRVALVVGGGNIFRGKELAGALSVGASTADYIGMLATVQNALVLRDYFESRGIPARISSAIAMPQIGESYIPERVKRHLEKGRLVIFAAGLGVPFFTTDSCAVQRALEIKADVLIMAKQGVDGLYSGDPKQDPAARKLATVTADEVLARNLRVADTSAIALARDHGLTIKIVALDRIAQALNEAEGSTIMPAIVK